MEMNSQVIIPCVCGKKVVSIELKELLLIEFKDDNIDKYTRIARLLLRERGELCYYSI